MGQGGQPEAPPVLPAGGKLAVGPDLVVLSPTRRRAGKATSESEPQRAAGSSLLSHDLDTASISSLGWTPGGGTAVLNVEAQDIWSRLQSQAVTLKQCTQEFLATRSAIQVSLRS